MEEVKREIEKEYDGPVDILAGSKENEISDSGKGREDILGVISSDKAEKEIIEMLLRRPCTATDIAVTLNMDAERASDILKSMEIRGSLTVKIHGGKKYYRTLTGQRTGNE
jgi:predicted transcriptional regulator